MRGEKLRANLMTKAARAAVNAENDVALAQLERRSDPMVEDFGNMLDLQVVVARAEGAHLFALAFLGPIRNLLGPGSCHATVFLDAREILFCAVALFDCPFGAAAKHGVHFFRVQTQLARAADSGGNPAKQRVR